MTLSPARDVELPLRSAAATELLSMLDDPDIGVDALGRRLALEPSLVARLLVLANSPFYAPRSEIVDVESAVVTIGQSALRALVLGLAIDSMLADDLAIDDGWWDRAIATAAAASVVAEVERADAGAAFCAGLLADVGHLVMALSSPHPETMCLPFGL